MRWVGHVARIGVRQDAYKFGSGNLRERNHLEDAGIDGRILRWILRKWDEGV